MTDPLRSPSGRYIRWGALQGQLTTHRPNWIAWSNQPLRVQGTIVTALDTGLLVLPGPVEFDWVNVYDNDGRPYGDLYLRIQPE